MVRRTSVALATTMLLAMFGAGCSAYSSFGFPVEQGDIEAGEQVFIDYRCHRCHTVAGVALPEIAGAASPRLELGGETSHVTAYSELVTSIINPNHKISDRYREQLTQRPTGPLETQMPMAHIETMTIRQLINLVAFLDSRYVLNPGYVYDFDDSDIAP